jgi:hypothetical protein
MGNPSRRDALEIEEELGRLAIDLGIHPKSLLRPGRERQMANAESNLRWFSLV